MAMRKANDPLSGGKAGQSIEQLQQRFEQLNKQKIQCETKLDAAHKQLDGLRHEAREKYGTDDLAELQAKLEQMKVENETKRANYQAQLDQIESDLSQVEQNFQAVEAQSTKVSR